MQKVSRKYDVTPEEIKSNSRHSRIILPRFTAMYLARKLTDMTTTDIGKEFGDRDHSTVVNAVNKIEENLKNNTEFKEQLEDIIVEIRS
jgi:chromosomal replication initiator protein